MKTLAKISAVLIFAAMAAFAFGCGPSDGASQASPADFDVQDMEINNPGYYITDEGNLSYAFEAVNPNDGHVAEDVVFTVEAYDANGSMIAGSSETVGALYPGVETAVSGETELFSRDTDAPKVARLSVATMIDSVKWAKTTITNQDIEDSVNIVSPRMSTDDAGNLLIKASVQFAEGEDMKLDASQPTEFRAVALLFDASGNAICGTAPVTFTLQAGTDTYDFAEMIENPPTYAECNLYVTPLA